ncbi:MAG: S9 family peptidase [Lentimicrobiaceae bacterium]|nr:S9 family peptidase [Lentimicrobiaceae bacterium]
MNTSSFSLSPFSLSAFCFLLSAFSLLPCSAQTLDLNDLISGKYRTESLQNLRWRTNTNQYVFVKNDTVFLTDAKTAKKEVYFTFAEIRALTPEKDLGNHLFFNFLDENTLYFPAQKLKITNPKNNPKITFYEIENIIDQSINDELFVVKEDGAVFVKSVKNNYHPIIISLDTGKHIVFGKAVHRNEWDIDRGQYISPKGNYIAFYRMDESMVEDYPRLKGYGDIATVEMIKYPMAGRASHEVTVGIFDVNASTKANKPVYHYVKTHKNDGEFLISLTFSPDEKSFFITHLNRAQNHAKLIEYDVATGNKVRVLLEELDERWVEPSTPITFLNDGNFIWKSDRNGFSHLFLYDKTGTFLKQLTTGNFNVINILGLDAKQENLFFTAAAPQPTDRNVFCVHLKKGNITTLTSESGAHNPNFSSYFNYFIDDFNNLTTPREITLRDAKGKILNRLLYSKNPYAHLNLGNVSMGKVQNAEQIDLYYRTILPPNFDPNKKYPVFLYVYGGPHSQMVTNTFMSGGGFLYYMAQQGFIVFSLDNRGTANRGSEFEKVIHRRLGTYDVEDQMCGINYLKSLPYVDENKICVDGWSYGAFMVLSLITQHPEVFASASLGGPVVDWKWYEVYYGERYMDTPEENPEGYAQASILDKVGKIKANTLIFHGGLDDVVVQQHSLELLEQAVKEGVLLNYYVYPSHEHNVRGKDRVHLWRMIENHHKK